MIPETFRPAVEAQKTDQLRYRVGAAHDGLQPDDHIDGRFAASEQLANGYYNHHINDSMGTLPDQLYRNPDAPRLPLQPRASFDSFISGTSTSAGNSVYFPRRVESIMGEEDRRKYFVAQSNQKEAGGAHYEARPSNYGKADEVYGYKHAVSESTDSVDSAASSFGYHPPPTGMLPSPPTGMLPSPPTNYSSPSSRAASPSPPSPGIQDSRLTIPEQVHRPVSNYSARGSAGRSPLARLSLVRTAGSDGHDPEDVELEPTTPGLASPESSAPTAAGTSEEREGRPKERKKLTKKPHRPSK